MAKTRKKRVPKSARKPAVQKPPPTRKFEKHAGATGRRKPPGISDARLETALRTLRETGDLTVASQSIRVKPERLKRIALRRKLIRKSGKKWIVSARLPRRMLLYTDGRELIVTTRNTKSASLIGRYMAAVRHFLRTNDPSGLAEFADANIKDTGGKIYPFEINPNVLYQLGSAGGETFEDIYRIVI